MYNEYVIKDRSSQEIADEYGCKRNTIQQWLSKHNIKKTVHRQRQALKPYQDKDYLILQHLTLHKTMTEIANDNHVSSDTIRYYLKKYDIPYWRTHKPTSLTDTDIQNIIHLYTHDHISANQIAQNYGTSHAEIIKLLQQHGIETRNRSEAQLTYSPECNIALLKDAEWLYKTHWIDNQTCKDIAKIIGCDAGTVRRNMQKLGIPTMSNAESKIGRMTGEKHPNWQGGLTSLTALLREYCYTNQVPHILQRDNYTCQCCGAQNVPLNVHHIQSFTQIVKEITKEHSELNANIPKERIQLYQIIVHDNRFLDENNLITYCKDCHLYKIHHYHKKQDN